MSKKIYNVNDQIDSHDIDLTIKEIDRWRDAMAGYILLYPFYKSEKELDREFEMFDSMPYSKKYITNEKALQVYGYKCQDMYYKLKKKFLRTDIDHPEIIPNIYRPENDPIHNIEIYDHPAVYNKNNSVNEATKEDIANEYIGGSDYKTINKCNSLDELEKQWNNYLALPQYKKVKSNDIAMKVYGKTNENLYRDQLKDYLDMDIDDTPELDKDTNINEIAIYENIKKSNDLVECARMINNFTTSDHYSLLESVIDEDLLSIMNDKIEDNPDGLNLTYRTSYMPILTPDEMDDLGVFSNDDNKFSVKPDNSILDLDGTTTQQWYNEYKLFKYGMKKNNRIFGESWKRTVSRLINGLQEMTNIKDILSRKQSIIELGWNPSIPFTNDNMKIGSKRFNSYIEHANPYNIIGITSMVKESIEINNNENEISGIYIVIPDMITDKSGVYISFNSELKNSIILNSKQGIGYTKTECNPLEDNNFNNIRVYFIPVQNNTIIDLKNKLLSYLSNTHVFNNNYLSKIINSGDVIVSNSNLLCTTVINGLITMIKENIGINSFILDKNNKNYIYLLYNGDKRYYNSNSVKSAIIDLSSQPKLESSNILNPYLFIENSIFDNDVNNKINNDKDYKISNDDDDDELKNKTEEEKIEYLEQKLIKIPTPETSNLYKKDLELYKKIYNDTLYRINSPKFNDNLMILYKRRDTLKNNIKNYYDHLQQYVGSTKNDDKENPHPSNVDESCKWDLLLKILK